MGLEACACDAEMAAAEWEQTAWRADDVDFGADAEAAEGRIACLKRSVVLLVGQNALYSLAKIQKAKCIE